LRGSTYRRLSVPPIVISPPTLEYGSLMRLNLQYCLENYLLSQKEKTGSGTFCWEIICWKTGWTPRTEISGNAIPRIPSNLAATKVSPGSLKRGVFKIYCWFLFTWQPQQTLAQPHKYWQYKQCPTQIFK